MNVTLEQGIYIFDWFGMANAVNDYQKLKIRVVCVEKC